MATTSTPGRDERLDRLRGPVPPRPYDARTIAALTANPGCARRAVLDAAGVDKRAVAELLGSGPRFGRSPFAISRGNAFEKLVKADGGAALLRLLRERLGIAVGEHEWIDLGGGDRESRYRRTGRLFAGAAAGSASDPRAVSDADAAPAAIADHPLLALEVAGRIAYLEANVVVFPTAAPAGSGWQLAEIKSFPVIDGRADPVKAGEAATQAAVYVLALQELMAEIGSTRDAVSTDVVLVCPSDFTNTPDAAVVDVRRQLAAVRRQLDRLPSITALLDGLDDAVTFDLAPDTAGLPTRDPADLSRAVGAIEARYVPECVSRCEMAFHCRQEARAFGSTDLFGRAVRDSLGGVATVRDVIAFAARSDEALASHPQYATAGPDGSPIDAEAVRLLRTARRARTEALLAVAVA
jgi:hypothetical protein